MGGRVTRRRSQFMSAEYVEEHGWGSRVPVQLVEEDFTPDDAMAIMLRHMADEHDFTLQQIQNLRSHFLAHARRAADGEIARPIGLGRKEFGELLFQDAQLKRTVSSELRDGSIDAIERQEPISQVLFDAVDFDYDDSVSFSELCTALNILAEESLSAESQEEEQTEEDRAKNKEEKQQMQLRFVFRMFDSDGSGRVDKAEAKLMAETAMRLFPTEVLAANAEDKADK